MKLYVDPAACNGCGDCVDVCLNDAIHLVSGKAVLDQEKCEACAVCVDACPTYAITEEAPLVSIVKPVEPVAKPATSIVPAQKPALTPSPWLGTLLTFVGYEIVPRLLDVLEQRLLSPAQSTAAISSTGSNANPPLQRAMQPKNGTNGGGPKRHKRRYHNSYSSSQKERR
jgi:NAD-dependent dihydropyrimidine dehydrogenase PreA subunit